MKEIKRPGVDALMDYILGPNWWEGELGDSFCDEIGELCDEVLRVFCKHFGHRPIMDQCMKPEHDFCLYCMDVMPGQAEERTGG